MLLLWIIYVISVLFLLCFCAHLFIGALWSPAGKGLTSWLWFVMSNCEDVNSIVILCPLSYFNMFKMASFLEKLKRIAHTLTLNMPITTAADDTFCDIFPNLKKNKSDKVNIMPYLLFLKKQQNLKLSPAANYLNLLVIWILQNTK